MWDIAYWVQELETIARGAIEGGGVALEVFDRGYINGFQVRESLLLLDSFVVFASIGEDEQCCGPENGPKIKQADAVAKCWCGASALQGGGDGEIKDKSEYWISCIVYGF